MKEKEEVEEKARDEGKTRRSREESPSQEDESDKSPLRIYPSNFSAQA
jgi:hypothetical protein